MKAIGLHPALRRMLRYRMSAAVRRRWQSLRNRDNLVATTALALVAIVWLCGVVAVAVNREPFTTAQLRTSITNAMVVYVLWMFVKTAIWKPAHGLPLTAQERRLLRACPFSRRQLLFYHLAGTSMTTLVKSACVSLILMPDLPNVVTGFLGVFFGFTFLELLRTSLTVAGNGAGPRVFNVFRAAVMVTISCIAATLIDGLIGRLSASGTTLSLSLVELQSSFLNAAQNVGESGAVAVLAAPLAAFGRLATAPTLTHPEGVLSAALAASLVAIAFAGLMILDAQFQKLRRRRELKSFDCRNSHALARPKCFEPQSLRFPRIGSYGGIGPIIWRQWRSARRRWVQVLALCAPPACFSLVPSVTTANGYATEFLVAGLLGFFTMLLLCPTVKYDFRRDHSQLGLLKALPVHPLIVILGQICVPVLLVTGMQLAVLAIHSSLNPTPEAGHRILAVSLLLVPFNVLVFALENLIFLFAPHEEEQNGLEMFVRTVLVFTGKAVLLGLGLYALILWIHGAHLCSRLLRDVGIGFHPNTIFGMGLALAFVSAACVAVVLATAAFERLDVRSMVAGHK